MSNELLTLPAFSVVTPSFNMLNYLRRCHASVADQGANVEHIIVDALSGDGTADWLSAQRDITAIVERDRGMYDAVNKGLRRSRGTIVSYVNCDEQYLPGALRTVSEYFAAYPHVDVVFGDALLIKPDGSLLAYRKGYTPRWPYIVASHLYVLSCTMFMRRRVIEEGFLFDESWRDIGDHEFVVRLLRHGFQAAHIPRYLAAFTMTGNNMSAGANARRETMRARRSAPRWVRALRGPLNVLRYVEKAASGAYWQRFPLSYDVYAAADDRTRTSIRAEGAPSSWPRSE
jgi:glycosyltransferase involved in cell wall biosynthesis